MALDAQTYGFLMSVATAVGVTVVCVLVFSFIRNKFPRVYQFRRLIHQWKQYDDYNGKRVGVPSVVPRPSPFAWVSAALAADEDELVESIGLDATMYLRYLRSMLLSFALVAVVGVVILMPVYGTGTQRLASPTPQPSPSPNAENLDTRVLGLRVVSLANVAGSGPRMWATVLMEILSTAVFLFFMYGDYRRYAELRRRNLTRESPKNYAVAVYDVPAEDAHEAAIRARFETIVPDQVDAVVIVKANKAAVKLHRKLEAAVAAREGAEWAQANKGEAPQHRVGCCGMLRCWQPKVDSVEHWTAEQKRLAEEVVDSAAHAPVAPCAVVIFKNKRAASLLVQANMANDATQWNIEKMPEPKAVHWGAFHVPGYQAEVRRVGVLVAVLAITLFWTIPAFALASLVNLEALAANENLKFLRPVMKLPKALLGIIQGLLPAIVLAVILSLIPVFIRMLVRLERVHDEHIVDRKTRDYFYFFTIYGSFFCIVVGSSILEELQTIAKAPFELFNLLGKTIPGNGIFFANYIVVQTGIAVSVDLLNPVRLILVALFSKLAKTERQLRKAQANGCNPILFKRYGQVMLVAFMGIMYTPLAPIVPVCALFYFGYNYLVSRYNMQYNLYAESDGAGESYPGAFWGTLVALLLRHAVVIVLIGFKRGPMAPFAVIPLIMSIVFGVETGRRFRRVSMFGSLHDHFSGSSLKDEIPPTFAKEYDQPAVQPEEFENLNGVTEDPDHYHEGGRDIPAGVGLKDIEEPDVEAPKAAAGKDD